MNNILKKLKFDSSKVDEKNQIIKIGEEYWELIKAINKWEWDIWYEMADIILSTCVLAEKMWIDIEKKLDEKIDIINKRKY